ncbi:MAG: hypothetical protein FGM22_08300 [Burkholderiaceae bacterium]|nr:hypothetical protein [Burkholderiaceae bacterium]
MREAIQFTLGTNNAAFKSGLAEAKRGVAAFKSDVTSMVTGLFAGLGIQQLVSDFARVQDIADGLGTTAEAVQRVRGAAELAGTSVEVVGRAMAKLRSDGGDTLAKLGIDARAFAESGMDAQVLMIAEALDKIPDPQQRINVALEVFGAKGKEILPMLAQGYDSLKASMDGTLVASNETVRVLADADDKIAAFTNNIKVLAADAIGFLTTQIENLSSAALLAWAYLSNLPKGLDAAKDAAQDVIDAEQLMRWQREQQRSTPAAKAGAWVDRADVAGAAKEAKSAADYQAESAYRTIEEAKKAAHEKAKVEKEAADYQAESAARVLEDAKRAAHEKRVAAEREQKQAAAAAEEWMRNWYDSRQKDLGFASGISQVGQSGQRLAGVNYSVVNAEAEKGIRLQEEMRNYLKSIDEKKWTVEIPEAS